MTAVNCDFLLVRVRATKLCDRLPLRCVESGMLVFHRVEVDEEATELVFSRIKDHKGHDGVDGDEDDDDNGTQSNHSTN